MNDVIWKRMIYHGKDLGDYYLVSNTGEIKGVKTRKIRKKNINRQGYYFVCVSLGNKEERPLIKVHRAVAETFLENPNNYPVINHKDGNKLNNNFNNLEFCTYQHNTQHAYDSNLIKSIAVICVTTGEIFNSIHEIGIKNNYKTTSHISSCCRGKRATYDGKQWMYYSDYVNNNLQLFH